MAFEKARDLCFHLVKERDGEKQKRTRKRNTRKRENDKKREKMNRSGHKEKAGQLISGIQTFM